MSSQQHAPEPFVREPRYLVFKIKDALDNLSACELDRLQEIGEKLAASRGSEGKPPFNAVVVEQDWPEFDLVWEMIEARMTGKDNDARRISACVNACAGIDTELLEIVAENDKTLAGVIAGLEKQRDELLAALELCIPELRGWMNCHGEDIGTIAAIKAGKAAIASVKGGAA